MKNLYQYGFGLVTKIPPNTKAVLEISQVIGIRQNSIFGEYWEMDVKSGFGPSFTDTSYSSAHLDCHTDGSYLLNPPGIQFFHVSRYDGTGGISRFLDGWQIARQLKEEDSDTYDFLSKPNFEFYYSDTDHSFRHVSPVISLTNQGHVHQFRWNNYDRCPPLSSLPRPQLVRYHKSIQKLLNVIREPKNKIEILLEPSKMFITNNWRVMHGRTAFHGLRTLSGCYISMDDFMSRFRVLNRQSNVVDTLLNII
eukprot:TRINITY_DN4708_c0_g1_i4.p1 TRINITY_DN4708_c0_g1~~TRINITY_DN4708_c0_g1_i4.p1  ORF type:complete len:252 (-),score=17.90 TRINITY_DN4708_c0_g1_i4:120-875(-)